MSLPREGLLIELNLLGGYLDLGVVLIFIHKGSLCAFTVCLNAYV